MRTLLLVALFVGTTAVAATQSSPQAIPPTPAPPAATPAPQAQTPAPGTPSQNRAPSQYRNVRLDITITDTSGSGGPTKKAATLLLMHGKNGQVRSTGIRGGIINVDAVPTELMDGRVMVNFTLEYMPVAEDAPPQQQVGKLQESLTVILENGKPLIVTQSADPQSDRKVTVELTATLLK